MPRIEERIGIAASPTDVFRFCHDTDRRSEWDERVSGVEVLTGTPVRRGTLLRLDSCPAWGSVFSWEGEYVEFQFASKSTLRVIDAAPSSYFRAGTEEWRFGRSSDGGTELTVVWEYEPRGFLRRILDQLGRRTSVHRAMKRSLGRLKEMIEAES